MIRTIIGIALIALFIALKVFLFVHIPKGLGVGMILAALLLIFSSPAEAR